MLVSVSLTGGISEIDLIDHDSSYAITTIEEDIYEIFKATFDISVSLALLIVLSPILILIAIAIKITSPGPVIYSQKRLTLNNRVFTMYKFRSMEDKAEERTGVVWASSNDSRITPIGTFLRKTRLDELPQLINVIKGEMSLIGPRPERPELVDKLTENFPNFNKRTKVKAGITGLAQVSSGYASSVDDYRQKLSLDILYVSKKSILLDIKIALRTIITVITGSGAR